MKKTYFYTILELLGTFIKLIKNIYIILYYVKIMNLGFGIYCYTSILDYFNNGLSKQIMKNTFFVFCNLYINAIYILLGKK